MSIKPAALKKGDTIGVMAPSSYVEEKMLAPGIEILKQRGFQVFVHSQMALRYESLAGTDPEKIQALYDLWRNPGIKAVWTAGGGNSALSSLGQIDYNLIKRHKKILMGFSDVTALLNAFNARAGLTGFHGPVVKWLPQTDNLDHTFDLLAGKNVSYPMGNCRIIREGTAHGPLIGGNISVFCHMIGTPYMPKTKGAILFLEDTGDQTSRLDRRFIHLKLSGILNKVSGIILGQFSDFDEETGRPFGFTLDQIFNRHLSGLNIPIVSNAPFGHVNTLYTMPVGGKVALSATHGKISLALTEPAVKI